MVQGKWFLCAALTLATGSMLIAANVTTAPATQPADAKPRMRKLTQPWSFLKTLTPEQTAKIEKIHADAGEQIKKIDAKENDDIVALLTPEQVAELKAAIAKQKLERKETAAERRKEAATEPAK